jgi:soluble cytochrome b562
MIVDSSSIMMASNFSQIKKYERTEELTAIVKDSESHEGRGELKDKVSVSDKALRHLQKDLDKALAHLEKNMDKAVKHPGKGYRKAMKHLTKDLDKALKHLEKHMEKAEGHETEKVRKIDLDHRDATKIGLIKNLVEAFTGKEINLNELNSWFKSNDDHDDDKMNAPVNDSVSSQRLSAAYNLHETYYESAQMSFNAGGVVRTADGREISFSLDLMMSRELMSETNISVLAEGIVADNIIVNFPGPSSELSSAEFKFGIEPQDERETVSYLALGSGLLSLYLNNDGEIDSLSEVVGTKTGNGFAELAAYDEDGNGWIDENDSVFNQLQILAGDMHAGLKESNVGAIYLGSVNSEFKLKNDQNMLLGQIEKSGLFLNEDGTPGTIQQLSIEV